mmetsp:Transcript_148978/g.285396  ORF Transcript_148978/g.285396 Transcript_148978/m.285396 type:complete len:237 (+) Transcript_148978:98-808(+)
MSFASSLTARVANRWLKSKQQAKRWKQREDELLAELVVVFKAHCQVEADTGNTETIVALKHLARQIKDFPRAVDGHICFLGNGLEDEAFSYAVHGYKSNPLRTKASKFYKHILGKLAIRIKPLGFSHVTVHKVQHEDDADEEDSESVTLDSDSDEDKDDFEIHVKWAAPAGLKRNRVRAARGNVKMKCGVCLDHKLMTAMVPCGHLICRKCFQNCTSSHCPFCKRGVDNLLPMFEP